MPTRTLSSAPPAADAVPDEPLRVLVIDDDRFHAETVAEVLERAGYHCTVATSGKAGAERIEHDEYDVVLLVGGRAFMVYPFAPGPAVRVLQQPGQFRVDVVQVFPQDRLGVLQEGVLPSNGLTPHRVIAEGRGDAVSVSVAFRGLPRPPPDSEPSAVKPERSGEGRCDEW